MLNKQHDCFIGCDKEYNQAKTVLFGAPFDSTTSYRPGTRFAPKAIRNESYGIETYSPYQDRDLSDIEIMDSGNLDLPFGNTMRVLKIIEEIITEILSDRKKPLMIGGEHLISLGGIRAAYKKYSDLHVIQFDAHCDLRDNYIGEQLSHASVMRRAWEILGDGRIFQFGIRSGERTEFEFAKEHTFLRKFNLSGLDNIITALKNKPVYFTLDLDVLDTSVFPGTGTPEAGGIGFAELIEAIKKLKNLNIVGCDMNELCPVYDTSGASTAAACIILRELLLSIN